MKHTRYTRNIQDLRIDIHVMYPTQTTDISNRHNTTYKLSI